MEKQNIFERGRPSVIGYSEADFATLITEGKLYIDRTSYIQALENESNKNILFVRSRRFGKSLWLSILQYYYGVQYKNRFETLFGNLAIGQNPTPLRNSYLILRLQFAGIDVETDASTLYGFRENVKTGILNCMSAYSEYFSEAERDKIETIDTPANMMQSFFKLYESKNIPHQFPQIASAI